MYNLQLQELKEFKLPTNLSRQKFFSLIGNSIQVHCARYFLKKMLNQPVKFLDLFAGIGGFHLAVTDYGTNSNQCVLASDIDKDCQEVYQLNFPQTPFLLGDINNKEIQKKIIETNFELFCAGFPCQPYSKANTSKNKKDTTTASMLEIINQKRPKYLFFENVPQLVKYPVWEEMKEKLESWGYSLYWEKINSLDLGIPMNRPRIFIWAQKHYV